MEGFGQILTGAPWWVYVLFVYLVIIGLKATKPRTVSINRLVLLPLLFVAWSLYSLYTKLSLGYSSLILVWAIAIAIGAYFGIKEVRAWHLHHDRRKQQITIPGNYSTLVLIVLIFVLKFFWGYIYATRGEVSYQIYFLDTLTSAVVTGFFVGRAVFFFKSYRQ